MADCVRSHPKCNPNKSGPGFVPTRLVDLGEPGDEWAVKSIRIVNTVRDKIQAQYVTLSHCWGRSKPFWNLRKATLSETPVPEILLTKIRNKNIEEAITLARTIGVRYIWIDSLCIVQDDMDDWEREGQLMHQVYRNSHCNIAAVDSQDRDGGLFRDRVEDLGQQSVPVRYMASDNRSALFGQRAWRVLHSDLWQDEVLARALYSRAWVFQGQFSQVPSPKSSHQRVSTMPPEIIVKSKSSLLITVHVGREAPVPAPRPLFSGSDILGLRDHQRVRGHPRRAAGGARRGPDGDRPALARASPGLGGRANGSHHRDRR